MNANQKRYKITIQRPETTKQSGGSIKNTYVDHLSNIWADVQFQTGTKTLENNEIFNTKIINIYIDYRSGILNTMQLVYLGDNYKINYVREVGNKEALQINCEKINK